MGCAAPTTLQPAPAPPLATAAAPPADLVKGLQRTPKYLPCRFLYDDRGSQLYEQITALPEYYLYRKEQALLRRHADAIAAQLPPGGVVVELGCGDGSKTAILLEVMLRRHGPGGVRFCGVDCSAEALRQMARNLGRLLPQLPAEQVELVEAEYLAGVQAARRRHPDGLLSILWLGSSVGNFSSSEATELLAALREAAGERCQLLLCTDLWKDPETLRRAYDDSQGVSREFILNGVRHALSTLGHPAAADQGLWRYDAVVNAELKQVEMWAVAQRRVQDVLPGLHIEAGERALVEVSRKFEPQVVSGLAQAAGLCPGGAWGDGQYRISLLLAPVVALQRCWADTDSLFGGIADWAAQPIDLRRPFLFYYGHVAAFTKLQILPQEPSELDTMLSRGIDPLVTDPSCCHAHPPAPPQWPSRAQLAAYAADVRRQVLAAVRRGVSPGTGNSAAAGGASGSCPAPAGGGSAAGQVSAAGQFSMQALMMVLEHERQHQETLCYMLAQHRKALACSAGEGDHPLAANGDGLPPAYSYPADAVQPFFLQQCSYASASLSPTATRPAEASDVAPPAPATPCKADGPVAERFSELHLGSCRQHQALPVARWVRIPAGQITLGVGPAGGEHGFTWDCEQGRLGPLALPGLAVAAAPVTVAQFRRFVVEERGYERAELWSPEAFRHLSASGHNMPATWSLLPAGSQLSSTDVGGAGGARGGGASHAAAQQQRQQQQLWVHMPQASYRAEEVANCPVYVSQAEALAYCRLHGARLLTEPEWELAAASQAAAAGEVAQLESGGWEWTSSVFGPLPGCQPDSLYPGYSFDFFDGQHYVLRGASPYTHPSVARRSFRNWYQGLYFPVMAKFRLARDVVK